MSTDDRMETITDPALIRATDDPDERGDFPCCADRAHKESLGGDSESGTYNRSNRPPAGPCTDERTTPAPVSGAGLDLDASHVRTDPACTFHDGTTPPASRGKRCPACMRLDLDALHETICDKFTGMAEVRQAADLLVADVRRLAEFRDWWKASSLANAEDVRRLTAICHDWRDRSEAADAEVVTLRAKVKGLHEELLRDDPETVTLRARLAAVEALADQWADRKRSDGMSGNAWIGLTLSGVAADLRAALATAGEGQ